MTIFDLAARAYAASAAVCPNPLPCPFCDGTEVIASEFLDAREGAEDDIPTWACEQCGAEAPARVWNDAPRRAS